ncbi:hypothetical protein QNI19_14580 [Cytophagaceae bacterium DM2B3-1]|uniref:Transposase n=1 Tax=Xanthocytophaga flava TaxID=3048013 RepID=A0ABT7CKV3_9BACT|nr:hypothetical protein [Xanthocytophaga flavus]MDJ1494166.1 hypothetical protein [Xanthocytophaga flavus]
MPIRKSDLIKERNAKIVNDYQELYKKGYRLEACLERLSKRYWLVEGTIYNILYATKRKPKGSTNPSIAA